MDRPWLFQFLFFKKTDSHTEDPCLTLVHAPTSVADRKKTFILFERGKENLQLA
jgi:hypothetical protein